MKGLLTIALLVLLASSQSSTISQLNRNAIDTALAKNQKILDLNLKTMKDLQTNLNSASTSIVNLIQSLNSLNNQVKSSKDILSSMTNTAKTNSDANNDLILSYTKTVN